MMATPNITSKDTSKKSLIIKALRRKSGADINELQEISGWQTPSIRAMLTRLRADGYTIARTDPKRGAKVSRYKISARSKVRG